MNKEFSFIFSNGLKYILSRHILYWLVWLTAQGFISTFLPSPYPLRFSLLILESLALTAIVLPANIFLTYTLLYFVIPTYILPGKYIKSLLWTIVLFILTGLLSACFTYYTAPKLIAFFLAKGGYILDRPIQSSNFISLFISGLRAAIAVSGFASAIKLMKYWFENAKKNISLEKEKITAELQSLRAQIHPHFLFNTLNNIYSYTQDVEPTASKMLLKLSGILRYITYECNQESVPLAKELNVVNDYIALQRVRYDERLYLNVELPEHTKDYMIAPLLLLPLIENCFKHGSSKMLDQPWIKLRAEIKHNNSLEVKIINGKAKQVNEDQFCCGVGLNNVKRRLELLYPNKHQLAIISEDEIFIVNLKLELQTKKNNGSGQKI